MKRELRDIFPEPEQGRAASEFIKWYEAGVRVLKNNPSLYEKEVLLRKRDSKRVATAKRLAEESGPLYNLLNNHLFDFAACTIIPRWGSQKFDAQIKNHPLYDFIEIVTVGESKETADARKRWLDSKEEINVSSPYGLEIVKSVVDDIEQAIKAKIGKAYGSRFALLVSYNDEKMAASPWKKELCKQLKQKNISHGCFVDIFITGFSMGAPVLKLP